MSAHRLVRTTLLLCAAVLGALPASVSPAQAAETVAPPHSAPADGAITGRVVGPPWARLLTVQATPMDGGAARTAIVVNGADYTLAGLAPGRYLLRFAGGEGVRPAYHGGVLSPEDSTIVTVRAGDSARANASLRTDPTRAVVTGILRDAAGSPVPGRVDLMRRDPQTGTWATQGTGLAAPDGSYAVSGPAGAGYVLRFLAPGLGPVHHPSGATVVEAEQLTLAGGTTRTIDADLCPGGPCIHHGQPAVDPIVGALGMGLWRSAAFRVAIWAPGVEPTGTVSVRSGGGTLRTVPIRGGQATFTVPGLRPGLQRLTLVYSGGGHVRGTTTSHWVRVW